MQRFIRDTKKHQQKKQQSIFRSEFLQKQKQKRKQKSSNQFNKKQRLDSLTNPLYHYQKNIQHQNHQNYIQQKRPVTPNRTLYIFNLPKNITENQVLRILNQSLRKMNPNQGQESQIIVKVWLTDAEGSKYGFLEFRTKKEAQKGLNLCNTIILGHQIRISRRKTCCCGQKPNDTDGDRHLDEILKQISSMKQQNWQKYTLKTIYVPSKILILKHIVPIKQLCIQQQYQQILKDIESMAESLGTLNSILIPRYSPSQLTSMDLELNDFEFSYKVKDYGHVFLQYQSIQSAKIARNQSFSQENIFRKGRQLWVL